MWDSLLIGFLLSVMVLVECGVIFDIDLIRLVLFVLFGLIRVSIFLLVMCREMLEIIGLVL